MVPRVRLVDVGLVSEAPTADTVANSPADAAALLSKWAGSDREHFLAVHLDRRRRPVAVQVVAVGCLHSALVHPREVFKAAVLQNADSLVVAHNHPSGCLEPSEPDLDLTQRMVKAGEILGIAILDHIIVSTTGYVSLRERGLLGKESAAAGKLGPRKNPRVPK